MLRGGMLLAHAINIPCIFGKCKSKKDLVAHPVGSAGLDAAGVCGASSTGPGWGRPGRAVCWQSQASDDPSHDGALAGGLPGDYLDDCGRTASDTMPCDCSFSPSAAGVGLVSVHTHHLYETLWGFF